MREVREYKNLEAKEAIKPSNQEMSFSGRPETYLSEIKQHQDKAASLERKANVLESAIRRGKESQSRMPEVTRLRKEASAETREVERAKEHMRDSLRSFKGHLDSQPLKPSLRGELTGREITAPSAEYISSKWRIKPKVHMHYITHDIRLYHKPEYIEAELRRREKAQVRMPEVMRLSKKATRDAREIRSAKKRLTTPFKKFKGLLGSQPLKLSFRGGLGGREIVKINAESKFSAARSKEQRAYEIRSKADRAAWSGDNSKTSILRSEASRLLNQANTLRAEGQRILSRLHS